MKDLASLLGAGRIVEELSKPERHKLLNEFHKKLNKNIESDNDAKIKAYCFDHEVPREAAVKALKNEPRPDKRIYSKVEMRRIAVMVSHLDDLQLRDFLDMCNGANHFNKCFFGSLKVKNETKKQQ